MHLPPEPRGRGHAPGDALVRRCRRCGGGLDGVRGHVCPACGEGFDLADPRTFRAELVERILLLHDNAGKVRMAELSLLRSGIHAIVQEDFNAASHPVARLWVARDEVEAAVEALEAPPERGEPWTCTCGERHEGQFGECWSCGATRQAAGGTGNEGGNGSATRAAAGTVARGNATDRSDEGEDGPADLPPARTAAVPDVDELVAWYRELLGLEPTATTADGAWYEHDETALHVRSWTPAELAGNAPPDPAADDPRPVFVLRVPSIEHAMDRLEMAGASFIDREPIALPRCRAAMFLDPFGVLHEVREPPGG